MRKKSLIFGEKEFIIYTVKFYIKPGDLHELGAAILFGKGGFWPRVSPLRGAWSGLAAVANEASGGHITKRSSEQWKCSW